MSKDKIVEEAVKDVESIIKEYGITRRGLRELMQEYLKVQRARVGAELRIAKIEEDKRIVPVWTRISHENYRKLEKSFREALMLYSSYFPDIEWAASSIKGVRHIAAAGVAAFITDEVPHVGHVWSYFGLVPGATRGNHDAKSRASQMTLLVIMAKDEYYYPLYRARKNYEWRKNISGENAESARLAANKTDSPWLNGLVNPEYVQRCLQENGTVPINLPKSALLDQPAVPMLTPPHIDNRAKRWLAKLLISHMFEIAKWYRDGQRTVPYSIKYLGHEWGSYIPPKNAPWGENG